MDRSKRQGQILDHAVELASRRGLDGLSIGVLADEVGLSKSGLFDRFGSKEELQLATLAHARGIFSDHIAAAVEGTDPGTTRLEARIHISLPLSCTRCAKPPTSHCSFLASGQPLAELAGPVADSWPKH
jgi:AcrR family transcriptional regulator